MRANYLENIDKLELRDRFITELIFKKMGKDFVAIPTKISAPVDLKCTFTNKNNQKVRFNIEVKEANGDYPNVLLRKDKLERMQDVSKGVGLVYVVINGAYAYIYNTQHIDWDNTFIKDLYLKITLYDPNSGYDYYPTYFIPKEKADKVVDITDYLAEYANFKQAQEEALAKE